MRRSRPLTLANWRGFPSETNTPLDASNLLRVIRPALHAAGIEWHGFHGFRRGLATNLHGAGVNDLTIQRVLRHSDVSVTRRAYIKRLPQQAVDALGKLQDQINADEAKLTVQ